VDETGSGTCRYWVLVLAIVVTPRLRHEMSLPAQTLGSWVRIPLEAWMSVSVSSVCCPV
jgi:hypothetical protein